MTGGTIIREARRRAGLTQKQLAQRLGTTQSVIARWEADATRPSFETLKEVVRACDFELTVGLAAADPDHDRLIGDALARSPRQRLDDLLDRLAAEELLHAARQK